MKKNKRKVCYRIILACAVIILICAAIVGGIAIFDKGESKLMIWTFSLLLACGVLNVINIAFIKKKEVDEEEADEDKFKEGDK